MRSDLHKVHYPLNNSRTAALYLKNTNTNYFGITIKGRLAPVPAVAAALFPPNNGRRCQDITLPLPQITSDGAGQNNLYRGKRWACGSPNDCHLDFGTLRAPDDDGLRRRDLHPALRGCGRRPSRSFFNLRDPAVG